MANKKQIKIPPIKNPELEKVIAELKQGSTPEKQNQLTEELKKARLLSPCDFDVKMNQNPDGTLSNANPSQIKFFLINTNDGHTFFPVYTDIPHANKMSLGKDAKVKYVVRQVKDFDVLLQDPNSKATGLVLNPGVDNIVIPQNLVAVIAGRKTMPKAPVTNQSAPLVAKYSEPSVYPTKMAMAIYDRAEETKEIQHVWLKQKTVGHEGSFYVVVESDSKDEHVLNEIREVAVPLSKNVPVEVVFSDEKIMKDVIKDSVALFDRSLDL